MPERDDHAFARPDAAGIAEAVLAAAAGRRQIEPFTRADPELALDVAYAAAAHIRRAREARGERPVGRKVGFTNKTIWSEYGVYAPIWGPVYETTLHRLLDLPDGFDLSGLIEPRIEPEIVFGLARAPAPGMGPAELSACVGWVAHGFEVVQSIFPGWRFRAPDTIAAFALHGALLLGPRHAVTDDDRATWREALAGFEIDLLRDGVLADRGLAANVLDGGPLMALAHLAELLEDAPEEERLAAGEIVSTGTLTRALPIRPGERWATTLSGIALEGIEVSFRGTTGPPPRPG